MTQSSDLRPDGIGLVPSGTTADSASSYSSTPAVAPAYPEPGPWPSYVPRIRTFESLRYRDFRLLWLSQGGGSMGQWVDQITRSWLIYQMTGSALDLGLVSAARALPMLLLTLVAGVFADRYGRKALLVISQVINAILGVTLATLVLTGRIQVWHIYVTALLAGSVMAFGQPTRQSLISDLVGKKGLTNAIALNSAIFNLMRSLGPAIAGLAIAFIGVSGSYYIEGALYVLAAFCNFKMCVPDEHGWRQLFTRRTSSLASLAPQAELASGPSMPGDGSGGLAGRHLESSRGNDSFFGSLGQGFDYIFKNPLILSLMFLGLAPMLLGMPFATLMPIFAINVLHGGSVEQGLLLSAVGIGSLVGALAIASIGSFRWKGVLLLAGATLFGVSLMAFARSTWLPLSLLFLFFAGMSNTSYTSQDQTIIQTLAPAHMRGRVLSIYGLNRGLMPLGSLLAGALAAWFGGPWAVALMGGSCAVVAIGVAIYRPEIREIDI